MSHPRAAAVLADLARAGVVIARRAPRVNFYQLNTHHAFFGPLAVTDVLAGRRSADPDHQRAADLLDGMGASTPASKDRVHQLRALLSKKNAVEYESRRATAREARDSVERATRLFRWAAETVDRARV
jgi:hypothetical protein